MFKYEHELVTEFESGLTSQSNPFRIRDLAHEFNYRSGRTDIVGLCGKKVLYAFEAKLTKWKEALHQAYRNSSFAHYSYVVLPEKALTSALANKREFERRGIGLCIVGQSGIKIAIKARKKDPLQPWLTNTALCFISTGRYDLQTTI